MDQFNQERYMYYNQPPYYQPMYYRPNRPRILSQLNLNKTIFYASKTISTVNQLIPIINQVQPLIVNTKRGWQIIQALKKVDSIDFDEIDKELETISSSEEVIEENNDDNQNDEVIFKNMI